MGLCACWPVLIIKYLQLSASLVLAGSLGIRSNKQHRSLKGAFANVFAKYFCLCVNVFIHQFRYWHGSSRTPLQWRHNERDGVSNHQPSDCLLNRLFRRRSKKTSKLRVTGLCAGNSPVTGEIPAQKASNAEIFPFDDFFMHLHWWHVHV